ncbi:hypothetical protein [Legionella sp. PC997]|uniref:hypothetical protein n=1 Tax=Legionella sp. PC997 TaxID=2755562 RepID=UPI0015FE5776|nr:hypothetical protein [Legionella sp. PC997]QMT60144.1 hypothetical protein HBNCFIEN_01514 [Legionella sp. PC997]
MKKTNQKYQPVAESIIANEPKTSSIAFALQQFRKEAEKKEAAEEAAKVRCRVCFKEIAPKRVCSGHGANRDSSENSDATSNKASEKKANPGEDNFLTKPRKLVITTDELIGNSDLEPLDEQRFDWKIIEELIIQGRLLVDNDRESKTLTIKLLCESNSLTEEQRRELKKFLEVIIKDLHKFTEEHHLAEACAQVSLDKEGTITSLRITMPTLAIYDEFIRGLANNLLPKVQVKDKLKNDQSAVPNPRSMELKPFPSTGEEYEMNEKEQKIFTPSPFKMQPW